MFDLSWLNCDIENYIDALKMYWMATAHDQFEQISEQTAAVISKWLKEEEKVNE